MTIRPEKRLLRILEAVYKDGEIDATPYVKRFVGMLVCYPIGWLVVTCVRLYRGDGWHWFYMTYLIRGEGFLLGLFMALNLYAISKYGWRRFFRLVRNWYQPR